MAQRPAGREATPFAAARAGEELPSRRRWAVLSVLAAVAFMAQLDLFIVNVALPAMARSFQNAPLNDLSWVLNAYAITFAALLVPMGRLADHLGRRRFLLLGVAAFTAGSAICAAAPSLAVMVGGRVVQAAGAAMIVPTSLGLLYPAFPKNEHTKVVGMLVEVNWRLIFLINLPIGIATIVAGLCILPEVRARKSARLPDPLSAVVLVATLAVLTFATVQSSTWGWGDARTIVLLAVAAATGIITVWRTVTHPHALIEASLFRSRQFTTATVALFLFFLGLAAWLLLNVLLFEDEWHWSMVKTGIALIPGPFMTAVLAVNAGRVAGHVGRVVPAIAGPLLFAGGAVFWVAASTVQPDYGLFVPGMIIAGSGAGLTQAPLFAAAGTLAADRAATGSAVLNMARQVGSAIGVAILVTILASGHGISGYQHGFDFIIILMAASGVTSAASAFLRRPARVS